ELLLDWKQNADEIIVKLNLGSGALKVEDVNASFTDTDCVVKLPDGRQWSCQFYEEIEGSCSKIQCKKGNFLHLVLQKKIPLHTWSSLLRRKDGSKELAKGATCWENGKEKAASSELAPEEPRAEGAELPRSRRESSNPKRAPGRSETMGGKSPASPGMQSGPSAKRAVYLKVAPTEEEPNARVTGSVEPSKGHSGRASSRRNGRASQIDAPTALTDLAPPLEKVPGNPVEQGTPLSSARTQQMLLAQAPIPAHEMGSGAVALAKEAVPVEMPPLAATTEVFPHCVATCVEKRVLQPGSPAEALRGRDCAPVLGESSKSVPAAPPPLGRDGEKRDWNLIEPDQCTYNFTVSRIDVCLKKRQSQRWGGLEAPATRVGGAKVAMPTGPTPLDKNTPGSNQHPLSSKEEARASDKEKPRVEDGGLDGVAARTAPEHVAVKQEPHIPSPKPTCMVPPMTHSPVSTESVEDDEDEDEKKKVCLPGFTGLVNLGNTCFMNSVIQSLSNTRELRDYFHGEPATRSPAEPYRWNDAASSHLRSPVSLTDRSFESEINYNNPLGTGGRLAIGFAMLLRALWKGTHHAFQPSKLKAVVASKASQFTGYAQHDAQEFMAFLLDGLHEDLNRIQNKPYTETVDSDGRPDEVVAEEAWQRHKMRNDSFIVDLFQGQYKSKLVCPVCSKVSITFDPFLYLPVPLPQKQKVLTVYYFAKEPHKKPIKFLVSISKENSSAMEVLDSVAHSVRVKPENLRLAEVIKNRFHRMFLPSNSLDTVSPTDLLFCFEVLSPELAKERVVELQVQQRPQVPSGLVAKCAACQKKQLPEDEKLRRCTRCYRVGYCNVACQKTHWPDHKALCRPENIGFPFLISVPESRLTYARLAQLLEGYARWGWGHCKFLAPTQGRQAVPPQICPCLSTAAIPGYQHTPDSLSARATQFYINKIDAANREHKLEDKGDTPLELTDDCSLALVWKNNERLKEFVLVESKELECVEDPGSASEAARAGHFTLEQCLNLFTKPEVLAPEEAW
ncbi:UBP19 hydrolase, partial [Columbina picui]|nr:UBP19 hydrolase [Columbina picui]